VHYSVKDINIYYETYGSGIPVIMIHGWGPDHRIMKGCMEPVFKSIKAQFKRIYFDMPGMGKTRGESWIKGSDQMLDLILDFIDGIIPQDQHFLVVGESYGGYLARGVIKKRASNVNGLLLICPVALPETQKANSPDLHIFVQDRSLLNSLSDEDRRYFESINVIQNKKVWYRFKDEILTGLKIADNDFLERNLGQNVPFTFNVDKLDKPFIKPTLMIMGRQDSAVGYKDIWLIIENYPRATFVILDKAGHNLQIEQDVLFNDMVKDWLNRVLEENN